MSQLSLSIVGKGHRAGYKQQQKHALNAKFSAAADKKKMYNRRANVMTYFVFIIFFINHKYYQPAKLTPIKLLYQECHLVFHTQLYGLCCIYSPELDFQRLSGRANRYIQVSPLQLLGIYALFNYQRLPGK